MAYVGFNNLKGQLQGRPGVTNPAALAAAIGAKKYGASKMQHAAATHHSLKGAMPASKRRKHRGVKPPQPPQRPAAPQAQPGY